MIAVERKGTAGLDQRERARNRLRKRGVAAACTHLQTAIDESGAEVRAGDLPTVVAVREHLVLLFQNLISNAIKYRAPERPAGTGTSAVPAHHKSPTRVARPVQLTKDAKRPPDGE